MTSGKRSKKQRRAQRSRLNEHKRQGKRLVAPINTIGPITNLPWLRDLFPSLIWPCAILHAHGLDDGMWVIAKIQDTLREAIEPDLVYDGSLQSFEAVPEDQRPAALQALRDAPSPSGGSSLYEDGFPWPLVRALDRYDNLPGAWVFDGWADTGPEIDEDAPERFLGDVVLSAWHGQTDIATRAKLLFLRGHAMAGKVTIPAGSDIPDLLGRYPHRLDDDERAKTESTVRAMFGAFWGSLPPERTSVQEAWAASFWRKNWTLYDCHAALPEEPGEEEHDQKPPWVDARTKALQRVGDLKDRFLEAALAADPDLYAPDRHEVLSGLVNRQIRSVWAMASMPLFWSVEHGAPVIRGVVEARIVARWLMHKDDPSLYERFKDYGRGHLKLHLAHLREYADEEAGDTTDIDDEIGELERILERDVREEFQDIDISARFTKETTRDMAYAVGLIREYRLLFAPMSANVHGEWIPLEQYALAVCLNPLHRAHRIPNFDPRTTPSPAHIKIALDQLEAMVEEYADGLTVNIPSTGDQSD